MDSLIEAADRTFETKLPLHDKCKLAMKVIKLSFFRRVLAVQPDNARDQCLLQMATNIRVKMDENVQFPSKDNAEHINEMLSDALWMLHMQNLLMPVNSLKAYQEFIFVSLKLKRNSDVNRLIDLTFKNELILSKVTIVRDSNEILDFYSLCSHAYNVSKNIERSIGLVKLINQKDSIMLTAEILNNAIECCMKCKKDALAEQLIKDYSPAFIDNPESRSVLNHIMIKGYAKIGKMDKALEIYLNQFKEKKNDQEPIKFLDTRVLNDMIEY